MPSVPKLSPLASRLLDSGLNLQSAIALPDEPAAAPAPAGSGHKRLKLWELEDKYHCPVIGTCLSIEELVRFAKRFKFSAKLREEYALHTEAVGWARSRNEVSEALQRHLERKYEATLASFAKLRSDDEVRERWQECLARGDVAGPLWAVFSHRAAEPETRKMAYGDIHMLSHQIGAGQAADCRRLDFLEKESTRQKQAAASERQESDRQMAALRLQVAALQAQLAGEQALREENDLLRRRLEPFESGQALVEMGQRLVSLQHANDHLRAAAQRAWALDKTLQASRDEVQRVSRERDRLADEREALERLLLAAAQDAEAGCGGDCNRCDQPLSTRCVLYVGGRAALVQQYKALAERLGIRLIHHDGGQEEAVSRLPEMIQGVDAVVCPTDCVSHSAYYQLKSHCKRSGKPCLFFKGAGVSSFAVAMTRLASGQFSLAGTD